LSKGTPKEGGCSPTKRETARVSRKTFGHLAIEVGNKNKEKERQGVTEKKEIRDTLPPH